MVQFYLNFIDYATDN